ncbi:MAG: WecB/TagA/CpsF family glycosyltransferase [Bacteroidales bacterium]|nr:WecB/TagA/CpsF family glycosyltransferase [Bacteroidales bacterium]
MSNWTTTRVFDYNVFSDDISIIQLGKNKTIINTLNAYSYVVANRDEIFKTALQKSDILLPDGFPVVIAAKWLKKIKIKKIAGADIFMYLCNYLNEIKGSCFFLGSSQKTLNAIETKISNEFPNVKAGFFSPPYKRVFNTEDSMIMCEAVRKFSPNVLFVGMTAPKQEKWVYKHSDNLETKIICSIGAVFDFYAGSVSRPSDFWVKNNMEWFIRLLKEPKRLWKRYLIYSPLFFIDLLLFKMKLKKIK